MKKIVENTKVKVIETQKEVYMQTLTLLGGAFALVAALAWNEAVKALIEKFFPAGSDVFSKFLYAVVITVLVVLVTRYIKQLELKYKEVEKTEV